MDHLVREKAENEFIDISKYITKKLVKIFKELENGGKILFKDFSIYVCYFKAVLAKLLGVDVDKSENISLCLFTEEELDFALNEVKYDTDLLGKVRSMDKFGVWYKEYVYKFCLYIVVVAVDNVLKGGVVDAL